MNSSHSVMVCSSSREICARRSRYPRTPSCIARRAAYQSRIWKKVCPSRSRELRTDTEDLRYLERSHSVFAVVAPKGFLSEFGPPFLSIIFPINVVGTVHRAREVQSLGEARERGV